VITKINGAASAVRGVSHLGAKRMEVARWLRPLTARMLASGPLPIAIISLITRGWLCAA
jgi:hypothetical protein